MMKNSAKKEHEKKTIEKAIEIAKDVKAEMEDARDDMAVEALDLVIREAEQPHSEWIPCKERLPEEDEDVLAWIERDAWKDGSDYPTRKQEFAIGWHIAGRWNFDGYAGNTKCIAWMPLPEPYKEEGEAE